MPTIRGNVVILKSKDIKSIKIKDNSLVVTDNQPFDNQIDLNHSIDVITILVRSGRKKSKSVADTFFNLSKNTYAAQDGRGGRPKELNFFFSIEIEWIDGTKSDVNLGQGSNGPRNNWWIGSYDLKSNMFYTSDNKYQIEPLTLQKSIGSTFEKVVEHVPEEVQGIVKMIGIEGLKNLFGKVNVFNFLNKK